MMVATASVGSVAEGATGTLADCAIWATAENRVEMLDEVSKLLHEIRTAWVAIPNEARTR